MDRPAASNWTVLEHVAPRLPWRDFGIGTVWQTPQAMCRPLGGHLVEYVVAADSVARYLFESEKG